MTRLSVHFRIKKNLQPMAYKLTVLIPTLNSRSSKLKSLLDQLLYQTQGKPVQVLWMGDNKSVKVGKKRNMLLDIADGDFVSFIDDDDDISPDYISTILKAIDEHSDKTVICFRGRQTTDGNQDLDFRYDVNFGRNHKKEIDGQRWKVMLPDHLCVWKKSRISERFPDKNLAEDHDWARSMATTYRDVDQVLLPDILYYYNYDRNTSECRR